jgi:hypothetical protein
METSDRCLGVNKGSGAPRMITLAWSREMRDLNRVPARIGAPVWNNSVLTAST